METTQQTLPSRGLDWDVDQPAVRYGSIAAAVLAFIALVKFFPDHEKSLFPFHTQTCVLVNILSLTDMWF